MEILNRALVYTVHTEKNQKWMWKVLDESFEPHNLTSSLPDSMYILSNSTTQAYLAVSSSSYFTFLLVSSAIESPTQNSSPDGKNISKARLEVFIGQEQVRVWTDRNVVQGN